MAHTFYCFFFAKVLRRELKEKEYSVLNAVDQARVFLADQPIEAPEEPRKSLQSKTGKTGSFLHHKKPITKQQQMATK